MTLSMTVGFMGHAQAHSKDHLRRNARLWRSRSSDLLLRLSLQPLDRDQRGQQMAGSRSGCPTSSRASPATLAVREALMSAGISIGGTRRSAAAPPSASRTTPIRSRRNLRRCDAPVNRGANAFACRALASQPASHNLAPPAQLKSTIAEGPGRKFHAADPRMHL